MVSPKNAQQEILKKVCNWEKIFSFSSPMFTPALDLLSRGGRGEKGGKVRGKSNFWSQPHFLCLVAIRPVRPATVAATTPTAAATTTTTAAAATTTAKVDQL